VIAELMQETVVKNFFTTAAYGKNHCVKWHLNNPPLPRTLEEICADILALEHRNEELPGDIVGGEK